MEQTTQDRTGNEVVLAAHDVSHGFSQGGRRTAVLHGVSLTARAGEITAITGPSGSGKTTLLRIIGGLSRPDRGAVAVRGRDLYSQRDGALSRFRNAQIGFIFQDYRLLPHYDAMENVMMGLVVAGKSKREQRARARDALHLVGLSQLAEQRVHTMSGGQQQRVGIARALAVRPRVLIADEPTGNLDTARGAEVMGLFRRLRTSQGIGVVLVTHNDQLAAEADHRILLVDGRVHEDRRAAG